MEYRTVGGRLIRVPTNVLELLPALPWEGPPVPRFMLPPRMTRIGVPEKIYTDVPAPIPLLPGPTPPEEAPPPPPPEPEKAPEREPEREPEKVPARLRLPAPPLPWSSRFPEPETEVVEVIPPFPPRPWPDLLSIISPSEDIPAGPAEERRERAPALPFVRPRLPFGRPRR